MSFTRSLGYQENQSKSDERSHTSSKVYAEPPIYRCLSIRPIQTGPAGFIFPFPTHHAFLLEPHPVRIRLLHYSRAGRQRTGCRLRRRLPSRRGQCLRATEERTGVSEIHFHCPPTLNYIEIKKGEFKKQPRLLTATRCPV